MAFSLVLLQFWPNSPSQKKLQINWGLHYISMCMQFGLAVLTKDKFKYYQISNTYITD